MKLTLTEPRYLRESISIISDLVNEARFKINNEGIELVAMDPANVAMVIFKLLSSCFTEYEVKKETEIAINLSNLKQVLKRAKPNDTLTIGVEENKLKLEFKGDSERVFDLPILDLEDKEQKVPELSFPVVVEMDSLMLNDAIEDVDIVGESVTLLAEPEKFTVRSEGDLNKAKIEIKKGENTKIQVEGGETPIKSKYSIEYLKKMITGAKISDSVKIQFNKDYPLKIEYVDVDKVQLAFILAPRVEND